MPFLVLDLFRNKFHSVSSYLVVSSPDATIVNVQSIANNKTALIDYLHDLKEYYADTIIWDKINGQPAMANNVLNSVFEYVHCFSHKHNRAIGCKEFRGTLDNIVHIGKQTKNEYSKIHNATFPMKFAEFFVGNFSRASVLDLFGGTGTTLIACEQLNRKAYLRNVTLNMSMLFCKGI